MVLQLLAALSFGAVVGIALTLPMDVWLKYRWWLGGAAFVGTFVSLCLAMWRRDVHYREYIERQEKADESIADEAL